MKTLQEIAFLVEIKANIITYLRKITLFLFLLPFCCLLPPSLVSFRFLFLFACEHLLPPLLTSANESVPLLLLGCSRIVSARQQPRQKGFYSYLHANICFPRFWLAQAWAKVHFANAKVKIRKKFISFLFLAFASRRRPRGLQIRIKTNAKVKIRKKLRCFYSYLNANKNKNDSQKQRWNDKQRLQVMTSRIKPPILLLDGERGNILPLRPYTQQYKI